jgi:hypothetical protein
MSNYNNNLNLLVFVIDNDNVLESLKGIISIDSDFEEVAEEIATGIMANVKTINEAIEEVLKLTSYEGVASNYLLNNDIYCSSFEYEITTTDDNVILSLAYTT